jgi:hypothetical protein
MEVMISKVARFDSHFNDQLSEGGIGGVGSGVGRFCSLKELFSSVLPLSLILIYPPAALRQRKSSHLT